METHSGLTGLGHPRSGTNRDVDVTVEREPSTEDEDAVKGTNTATTTETHTSDTTDGAATESGDGSATSAQTAESETAASPTRPTTNRHLRPMLLQQWSEQEPVVDDGASDSETTADEQPAEADAETEDEESTAPVTE